MLARKKQIALPLALVTTLVISLATSLVTSLASVAMAQEEMVGPSEMTKLIGTAPISCDNLTIVEYKVVDELGNERDMSEDHNPTIIPFDKDECQKKIIQGTLPDYVKPLFPEDEAPEKTVALDNLSEAEIIERRRLAKEKSQMQVRAFRDKMQPLIDLCQTLGGGIDPDKLRACFWGGPGQTSSKPVQVVFNALIDNNRSNDEVVCNDDPITLETAKLPEFKAFLGENQTEISWPSLSQTLTQEGFHCTETHCRLMIMEMLVAGKNIKEKFAEDDYTLKHYGFFFLPRDISFERGKWHLIGRHPSCPMTSAGEIIPPCEESKPQRGDSQGICFGGEDQHILAMGLCGINDCGDEE